MYFYTHIEKNGGKDYEVKKSYQCHAGWCMRILYGSMWF